MAKKITKNIALKAIENKEYIHCFLGQTFPLIGADWSKESVEDLINNTDEIYIAEHPINHSLAVFDERIDKFAYFDLSKKELEQLTNDYEQITTNSN